MTEVLEEELIIERIDFISDKELLIELNNGRSLFVPLLKFETIKALSDQERNEYEIIDGKYLSFLSISDIYSIHDLAGF
jgi:hypothetical protein